VTYLQPPAEPLGFSSGPWCTAGAASVQWPGEWTSAVGRPHSLPLRGEPRSGEGRSPWGDGTVAERLGGIEKGGSPPFGAAKGRCRIDFLWTYPQAKWVLRCF